VNPAVLFISQGVDFFEKRGLRKLRDISSTDGLERRIKGSLQQLLDRSSLQGENLAYDPGSGHGLPDPQDKGIDPLHLPDKIFVLLQVLPSDNILHIGQLQETNSLSPLFLKDLRYKILVSKFHPCGSVNMVEVMEDAEVRHQEQLPSLVVFENSGVRPCKTDSIRIDIHPERRWIFEKGLEVRVIRLVHSGFANRIEVAVCPEQVKGDENKQSERKKICAPLPFLETGEEVFQTISRHKEKAETAGKINFSGKRTAGRSW